MPDLVGAQTCVLPGQEPEVSRGRTGDRAGGASLTALRTAWQAPPPRARGTRQGTPLRRRGHAHWEGPSAARFPTEDPQILNSGLGSRWTVCDAAGL